MSAMGGQLAPASVTAVTSEWAAASGGRRTLPPFYGFTRPRLPPIIVEVDQAAYLQLVDPQLADPSVTNAEPANDDGSHRDRANGQRPKSRGYQSQSSDADGPDGGRSRCSRARSNGLCV